MDAQPLSFPMQDLALNILPHVPPHVLIGKCTRVCKLFHQIITQHAMEKYWSQLCFDLRFEKKKEILWYDFIADLAHLPILISSQQLQFTLSGDLCEGHGCSIVSLKYKLFEKGLLNYQTLAGYQEALDDAIDKNLFHKKSESELEAYCMLATLHLERDKSIDYILKLTETSVYQRRRTGLAVRIYAIWMKKGYVKETMDLLESWYLKSGLPLTDCNAPGFPHKCMSYFECHSENDVKRNLIYMLATLQKRIYLEEIDHAFPFRDLVEKLATAFPKLFLTEDPSA